MAKSKKTRAAGEFERAAKAHIDSRGSAGTRQLYRTDLKRWLTFCVNGEYDPGVPTLEAATGFRDGLMEQLGDQTVRRVLSAVSSMYDASGKPNPFKSSKRLVRPSPDAVALTKAYTREEVTTLIGAAESEGGVRGVRDATIMQILDDTGLRVASVLALKREQIFRRSDGVVALILKVKKKGRVDAELPMTSVERLNKWYAIAPASEYVFPSQHGALTVRAVEKRIAQYGKRVGILDAHPHRFRATFITEALDHLPLVDVQAAVHHADPKTTLRYDRRVRGSGVTTALAKFRRGGGDQSQ